VCTCAAGVARECEWANISDGWRGSSSAAGKIFGRSWRIVPGLWCLCVGMIRRSADVQRIEFEGHARRGRRRRGIANTGMKVRFAIFHVDVAEVVCIVLVPVSCGAPSLATTSAAWRRFLEPVDVSFAQLGATVVHAVRIARPREAVLRVEIGSAFSLRLSVCSTTISKPT